MPNNPITIGQVPQHIAAARAAGTAPSLNQNARMAGGFAVIGYKGRRWTIKYRGDSQLLMTEAGTDTMGRPIAPAPTPSIYMVVVGVSAALSKNWYEKGFAEGDSQRPDCFSLDGVKPDPSSVKRQNALCASCKQNTWGSRINQENGTKGKACKDGRRLAMVPILDVVNDSCGGPMLLRIPTMSLRNLDRYTHELDRHGVDISHSVTVMSFNPQMAYPEIQFTWGGYIEKSEDFDQAMRWVTSDEVQRMLNEGMPEAEGPELEGEAQPAPTAPLMPVTRPTQWTGPVPAQEPLVSPVEEPEEPEAPPAPPPPQAAPASPFARGNGHAQAQPAPAQVSLPSTPARRGPGRPPGARNRTQDVPRPTAQPVQAQPQAAPAPVQAAPAQPAPVQAPPKDVTMYEEATQPTPVIVGAPKDMGSIIDGLLD